MSRIVITAEEIFDRLCKIEKTLFEINAREEGKVQAAKSPKHFYSVKEFKSITGMAHSTILYKCKTGSIKARQDYPNSHWQIHYSELQRFTKEAEDNGRNEKGGT